jgi:outer membrane protein assembly factor BamB
VWAFNGTCAGAIGSDEVGQISAMPMLDSLNNRLFFTSTKLLSGPTLWALDANDAPAGSRRLWSRDVGDSDSSLSFATTALTGLYVGTNAGRIYKLTSSSGLTCWGSTSDGCGGAATGDEQFFCADSAVDARATTCANGAAILKGLSVVFGGPHDGHAIFTTADGNVRMIDRNGVQRWRTHIAGASAPLALRFVGSGVVYVGGNDGSVHELSMATGAQTAARSVGGGEVVAGDPSYDTVTRRLYVTTSQGNLYAFNAPF